MSDTGSTPEKTAVIRKAQSAVRHGSQGLRGALNRRGSRTSNASIDAEEIALEDTTNTNTDAVAMQMQAADAADASDAADTGVDAESDDQSQTPAVDDGVEEQQLADDDDDDDDDDSDGSNDSDNQLSGHQAAQQEEEEDDEANAEEDKDEREANPGILAGPHADSNEPQGDDNMDTDAAEGDASATKATDAAVPQPVRRKSARNVRFPSGASLERTDSTVAQAMELKSSLRGGSAARKNPELDRVMRLGDLSKEHKKKENKGNKATKALKGAMNKVKRRSGGSTQAEPHQPLFLRNKNEVAMALQGLGLVGNIVQQADNVALDQYLRGSKKSSAHDLDRLIVQHETSAKKDAEMADAAGSLDGATPKKKKKDKGGFWLHTKSQPKTAEQRLDRATHYINEAINGRTVKSHRLSKWPLRVYNFMFSDQWRGLLYLAVLLHMCVIVLESPSSALRSTNTSPYEMIAYIIEWCCIVVELTDFAMNFYQMGPKYFFKKKRNYFQLIFTLVLLIDTIIYGASGFATVHITRPLRGLLLLIFHHKMRNVLNTFVKTVPNIAEMAGVILGLLIVFAIAGVQLFAGVYRNPDGSVAIENFDDFPSALLALFALITTENYPGVMVPAYRQSPAYSLFFIIFIVIGLYIGLSVLIAVVYDAYKVQMQRQVLHDRVKERRALMAAFHTLDEGKGYVTLEVWESLMIKLKPDILPRQIRLLFETLDTDNSGTIDVLEFFEFCDLMLLRFTKLTDIDLFFPATWRKWCNENLHRDTFQKITTHSAFTTGVLVLILVNTIVLCLYRYGISAQEEAVLDTFDLIILCLFTLEMFLKLIALGLHGYFSDGWNQFDALIVVMSWVSFVLPFVLTNGQGAGSARLVVVFRLLKLVRGFRSLRVFATGRRFRVLISTFVRIVPAFTTMCFLIIIIFYFFAGIGMEVFGGAYAKIAHRTAAQGTYASSIKDFNFDNIGSSYIVLFQLLTTSNWHGVMYAHMEATNPYASYFFVIFTIIVVMIVVNLVVALILEIFLVQRDLHDSDKNIMLQITQTKEEEEQAKKDGDTKVSFNVRKQRRWSRDLLMNDLEQFKEFELQQLDKFSGATDLLKLDKEREESVRGESPTAAAAVDGMGGFGAVASVSVGRKSNRKRTSSDLATVSALQGTMHGTSPKDGQRHHATAHLHVGH